ncbi:MAG: oxidoreductase [Bacteroidales bacterium]
MSQQVVLITGASSGIGKETARIFLENNHIVYGTARRVEQMLDLKKQGAHIQYADISDENSVRQLVDGIIQEQGKIDILVNNAGYGTYGAIEDVPLSEARKQFNVNVFGLAQLTQLVLPYMRAQKFGKIINISSVAGKTHTPLGGWYHASKHAVEGLSDCLRFETQPFGIDVIIIEPGLIATEWDGIALDSATTYSGTSSYKHYIAGLKQLFSNMKPAHPQLIANIIYKSSQVRKPKTRYVAGYGAKPLLRFKRFISDALFDSIMRKIISKRS